MWPPNCTGMMMMFIITHKTKSEEAKVLLRLPSLNNGNGSVTLVQAFLMSIKALMKGKYVESPFLLKIINSQILTKVNIETGNKITEPQ